jgi:hypothetical protein
MSLGLPTRFFLLLSLEDQAYVLLASKLETSSMVFAKILSGSFVGSAMDVTNQDPKDFFPFLFNLGASWELDLSKATTVERSMWGKEDFVARCIRALMQGRPVTFMGQTFSSLYDIDSLRDAIAGSGLQVYVGSEDGSGVVIGVSLSERAVH